METSVSDPGRLEKGDAYTLDRLVRTPRRETHLCEFAACYRSRGKEQRVSCLNPIEETE